MALFNPSLGMVLSQMLRPASFRLLAALPALVTALACVGPPAPDAAVCQDVIDRLCKAPLCQAMGSVADAGTACEDTLLARTGCGTDDFAFAGLPRERFLQCRAILLRAGQATGAHPACRDVDAMFFLCGDVEAFLRTGAQ